MKLTNTLTGSDKMNKYKVFYQTVKGYWRGKKRRSVTVSAKNNIDAEFKASDMLVNEEIYELEVILQKN